MSAPVTARVGAALAALDEQLGLALALPATTARERAERAARMTLLYARRAGWWRVLLGHALVDPAVPTVYAVAVGEAHRAARSSAWSWRDRAGAWAAQAEQAARETGGAR